MSATSLRTAAGRHRGLYPLWHYAPYSPRIWPLSIATGWAQALSIWDYSRGKVMSWRPSRGPGVIPSVTSRPLRINLLDSKWTLLRTGAAPG